jgi:hypothetical protein
MPIRGRAVNSQFELIDDVAESVVYRSETGPPEAGGQVPAAEIGLEAQHEHAGLPIIAGFNAADDPSRRSRTRSNGGDLRTERGTESAARGLDVVGTRQYAADRAAEIKAGEGEAWGERGVDHPGRQIRSQRGLRPGERQHSHACEQKPFHTWLTGSS